MSYSDPNEMTGYQSGSQANYWQGDISHIKVDTMIAVI